MPSSSVKPILKSTKPMLSKSKGGVLGQSKAAKVKFQEENKDSNANQSLGI